jgi:mRNA-degrading endonuclease toxin of MazEF toxin-antitoxin module
MADRGEVFQLKRRLGFGEGREGERVVVVQASALNSILPTVVVVPLEPKTQLFAGMPLAVRVAAAESGAAHDHVALPTAVRALPFDRLAPGRVGRLRPRTLHELDEKLRLSLDL